MVTARAQSAGESMCLESNAVRAAACHALNRPAMPVLTCYTTSKGITGTNLQSGWTIHIENMTRNTADNSITNSAGLFAAPTGTSPNMTWTYSSGCSGGSPLTSGSYKVYYVDNATGCASEPAYVCVAGNGPNALAGSLAIPTISSPAGGAFTSATTAIAGTSEAGVRLFLYVDGSVVQTATAAAGGAFSFTNLNLVAGQEVYITVELNSGAVGTSKCAAQTAKTTVVCYTTPPQITSDNNSQLTAGAPISGTSGEGAGTIIRVYTSGGTLVATTSVAPDGSWSTGAAATTPAPYNAVAGTTYYATAQSGSCGVSASSGSAAAATPTGAARCGTITGPLTLSAASVSGTLGTAVSGTIVNLYLDGVLLGSATTNSTAWGPIAVNTTGDNTLYGGGILTIGVRESGRQEVSCPASLTIGCSAPVQPIVTQGNTTILQGQTQTYTIENPVTGTFYGIADAASGRSLAPGVWASSTSPLDITTLPITTTGPVQVVIKATSLSGTEMCTITSATKTVTVNPISLPITLEEFTGRRAGTANVLQWKTASETGASHFEVQRSSDGQSYMALGEVPARGSHASYGFTDTRPLAQRNHYRLKLVDADGTFAYSRVVTLSGGGSSLSEVIVLPNPFQSEIRVSLTLGRAQSLRLVLVDESGRQLRSRTERGVVGRNNLRLPGLDGLAKGVYLLKIITEEGVTQLKLVKAN